MNESNLITKVWNYATILKDAGVAYTDYVAQITYLLFLKMDQECYDNLNQPSLIPSEFQWANLIKLDGSDLEEQYSKALTELSKQGGMIGAIYTKAQNKITEPAKLKRLFWMTKLNLVNQFLRLLS